MKTLRSLVLAMILCPLLLARPTAQESKKNLFPTGEGSTWEFDGKAGDQPLTMTATITSTKTGTGTKAVTVRWTTGGQPTQVEEYLVTATSVSRAKSGKDGTNAITPPIPVIKYPMEVGKSWKWSGKIATPAATLDGTSDLKVAAMEKVKTGAGIFDAYRVDMALTLTYPGGSQTIPNSYWFAPGVGMVKQSSDLPAGGKKLHIEAAISKYTIK